MDTSVFKSGWEDTSTDNKVATLQELENKLAIEEGRGITCKIVPTHFPSSEKADLKVGEFHVDPKSKEYIIEINEDMRISSML